MHIQPSKILKILLLTLLTAGTSMAQPLNQDTVTVNFSTLSWEGAITDLHYRNAGEVVPILVPNGTPSPELRYSGPPTLEFFTQTTNAEGQPVFQRQAAVTLPSGARHVLLIFLKNPDGTGYQVRPFPVPEQDFTVGTFNFVNLTSSQLAIRMGEESLRLPANSDQRLRPTVETSQNVNVQMAASESGDDWELIYRTRWASLDRQRAWVFVYMDEASKPRIRKYYQIPDAPQMASQNP